MTVTIPTITAEAPAVTVVTAGDNCATQVTDAGLRMAPGDSAECRIVREFLGQLGDKWTLLVILALSSSPMRFNALQRAVVGISHRMLTVTLRKLERDGLVDRATHNDMSPHTSYELTPRLTRDRGVSPTTPVTAVLRSARAVGLRIGRRINHFGRENPVRGTFPDQCVHCFGIGSHPLRGDGDARFAHQQLSLFALFGQNDGDDITGATRARCTTGPMQISLVLSRGIDVHDQFDVIDVNTACRDVRGNENQDIAGGELGKVAVAGRLGEIAVQVD